jgi:hypothetical protein
MLGAFSRFMLLTLGLAILLSTSSSSWQQPSGTSVVEAQDRARYI